MTVIAWDGKTLAADKQSVSNGKRSLAQKIIIEKGIIFAISGCIEHFQPLREWYLNGCDVEKYPKFQTTDSWSRLVVVENKVCYWFESQPYKVQVLDEFTAFGSGRDYALGAMAMGADAEKAVLIANMFDIDCGFGVDGFSN